MFTKFHPFYQKIMFNYCIQNFRIIISKKLHLLYFLIAGSLFSCIETKSAEELRLSISDSLLAIKGNQLEILNSSNHMITKKLAIVTTIWGECHICMEKFEHWEQLLNKQQFNEVDIVYIITTPYPEYFMKVYYPELNHRGTMLIDSNDRYFNLNKLKHSTPYLNTFLVDSVFNIILQGDPLTMPGMMDQYERSIKRLLIE